MLLTNRTVDSQLQTSLFGQVDDWRDGTLAANLQYGRIGKFWVKTGESGLRPSWRPAFAQLRSHNFRCRKLIFAHRHSPLLVKSVKKPTSHGFSCCVVSWMSRVDWQQLEYRIDERLRGRTICNYSHCENNFSRITINIFAWATH